MTQLSAIRRVQRVRHELRRRDLEVDRVEQPTPGFITVHLRGQALADFISLSFDDHVKLAWPAADGAEPVRRDFTPRRFDANRRELTIEFALHEHGPASDWARQAAPGQRLAVGGPRGSMIIPTDYPWHLLAGDASALPAVRRRLEDLPAGTRALVIMQVADPRDRVLPASQAAVELQWVDTSEELVNTVEALSLPDREGFAWCAGEASDMARLRQLLLVDKGHPRQSARIAAYWKKGASEYHENLE